jgi:hypothetical protein
MRDKQHGGLDDQVTAEVTVDREPSRWSAPFNHARSGRDNIARTVVFDRSSVEAAVTRLSFVPPEMNDRMPAVSELLISSERL